MINPPDTRSHPDHYSRFWVRLSIIRQNMNSGFWNFFFGPNYSWLYVLSYGISYIHLKSSRLTQECLEHGPFSTFCLIWQGGVKHSWKTAYVVYGWPQIMWLCPLLMWLVSLAYVRDVQKSTWDSGALYLLMSDDIWVVDLWTNNWVTQQNKVIAILYTV